MRAVVRDTRHIWSSFFFGLFVKNYDSYSWRRYREWLRRRVGWLLAVPFGERLEELKTVGIGLLSSVHSNHWKVLLIEQLWLLCYQQEVVIRYSVLHTSNAPMFRSSTPFSESVLVTVGTIVFAPMSHDEDACTEMTWISIVLSQFAHPLSDMKPSVTSTVMSLSRLSYSLSRRGQLHLPGITHTSKKTTEELLLKDAKSHHCFFHAAELHNHLSHQWVIIIIIIPWRHFWWWSDTQWLSLLSSLLSVYDLGASAGQLQKIYADEAIPQRPIILEPKDESIVVSKDNWTQYLENQRYVEWP